MSKARNDFVQLGQYISEIHADQAWLAKAVVQLVAPARRT
jgi:hypothetical protein